MQMKDVMLLEWRLRVDVAANMEGSSDPCMQSWLQPEVGPEQHRIQAFNQRGNVAAIYEPRMQRAFFMVHNFMNSIFVSLDSARHHFKFGLNSKFNIMILQFLQYSMILLIQMIGLNF